MINLAPYKSRPNGMHLRMLKELADVIVRLLLTIFEKLTKSTMTGEREM